MKATDLMKSRLTILRELLDLSQKEFADAFGISQSALSQLESGKTKLSMDTLQGLSTKFNVNCNWLVHGKGSIFIKDEPARTQSISKHILTLDIAEHSLIPLIKEEAHAGYLNSFEDPDYLKTLDAYRIPGFESGNYRLFEISGDSMLPTLFPREIVVSEMVDNWNELENGELCIIITHEGIVAKRIYLYEEDDNVLVLKSDNASYKTFSIDRSDIKEIWMIKAKITSVLSQERTTSSQEKLDSLEADIRLLKNQMKKIVTENGSDGKNKNDGGKKKK